MTAGPVMIDLKGIELDAEEQEILKHPGVGGIILFSRNYLSREQIACLIVAIRTTAGPLSDLLIAVDQEGGRVQRFRDDFTQLPAAALYEKQSNGDLGGSSDMAEAAGWLMAAELLSVGIDFSFAPVLDVDTGVSQVIGDRSFSRDPQTVARQASAFRQGMKRAGMAAVGKHFPGHGAVALDSHLGLPEDQRLFEEIDRRDLVPFKKLIDEGLEGIMPAHIIYSQIDAKPAGFSNFWLQNILRRRLSFGGAVFSDDLTMEGASWGGGFADRALTALEAGCDMVLVCNHREGAIEVLDAMTRNNDHDRRQRLAIMRGKPTARDDVLFASAERQQIVDLLKGLTA